ncbi:MAG: hypothetical protein IKV20_05440 [Clostridia bacterium]|nr:hypothetical protein [Clostridia bacterium]
MQLSMHDTYDKNFGISSLQLNRYAISEMMSLGFRYLSFTVTMEAGDLGITPNYVDLYTYDDAAEEAFFISSCNSKDPKNYEFYYKNGSEITVDLWNLYSCLTDKQGYGLMFILSEGLYWQPTGGGYITISNVDLTRTEREPTAEEKAQWEKWLGL